MPNGCVPGKKKKQIKKEKPADYKAEEEQELHNTEGDSPEDIEAIGSTVQTKNEGQEE